MNRTRGVATVVGLLMVGGLAFQVMRGHQMHPPSLTAAPMVPVVIDPSWVIDGVPVMRAAVFSSSRDGKELSGIWECDGPTKFEWHFGTDEAIYVLEGAVTVEVGGATRAFGPGDIAFFPAGTASLWNVPVHVKKAFTLHEPGKPIRWLRKLL